MSFETDLDELERIEPQHAKRIRGFMEKAAEEHGAFLSMNEHVLRYARDVGKNGAKNPFYLSAMIVPLHNSPRVLAVLKFHETHSPAYLKHFGTFIGSSVGQSQAEIITSPAALSDLLLIEKDEYGRALRWVGQYAHLATRALADELNRILEANLQPEGKNCVGRIYARFQKQQAEREQSVFSPDTPFMDPRSMARLLQLHSAGHLGGSRSPWGIPSRANDSSTAYSVLSRGLYALNDEHQLSLSSWKEIDASRLEDMFALLIAEQHDSLLVGRGLLGSNFNNDDRPAVADITRDLVMTAQLLILKGEQPSLVVDQLRQRGLALENVIETQSTLKHTVSDHLALRVLAPLRHLWDAFGIRASSYHGHRSHMDNLDQDEPRLFGRYIGAFGISGVVPIRAQEQLETRFPEMLPSYNFSDVVPFSQRDRIIDTVGPEIDQGITFSRVAIDSILLHTEIIEMLSTERKLRLLNDLVVGEPEDNVNYGDIFHMSRKDLLDYWVGHLPEAQFESWLKQVAQSSQQHWVESIVRYRRPSAAVMSTLGGRVIDACMAQDLGL